MHGQSITERQCLADEYGRSGFLAWGSDRDATGVLVTDEPARASSMSDLSGRQAIATAGERTGAISPRC